MNRKNKLGFTLVELMVVAIIVAILAAVAIPLMSGNKKKAQATEAQAGAGAIKMLVRIMQAEGATAPTALSGVKGLNTADLDGTYFINTDYSYSGSGYSNMIVTVSGTSARGGLTSTDTLIMSNINSVTTWGGTMLR
jgi:prepilin-type N-terminal cleavage/methylation domain-containing protein